PRRPPITTLLPYTTLFRSKDPYSEANARYGMARAVLDQTAELPSEEGRRQAASFARQALAAAVVARNRGIEAKTHLLLGILAKRSEEHTSELQSRSDLVCR